MTYIPNSKKALCWMQILLCFESQKTNCTEYSTFAVYNLRFSVLSCTRLKPYGRGSVRVLLMLWKYLLWPLLSSYPTEKKNIRVHCSLVLIFLNDIKTIISLWQNFTRHDETDAAFRPVIVIRCRHVRKIKLFLVRGIASDYVKRYSSLRLCSLLTDQRFRIFCWTESQSSVPRDF